MWHGGLALALPEVWTEVEVQRLFFFFFTLSLSVLLFYIDQPGRRPGWGHLSRASAGWTRWLRLKDPLWVPRNLSPNALNVWRNQLGLKYELWRSLSVYCLCFGRAVKSAFRRGRRADATHRPLLLSWCALVLTRCVTSSTALTCLEVGLVFFYPHFF